MNNTTCLSVGEKRKKQVGKVIIQNADKKRTKRKRKVGGEIIVTIKFSTQVRGCVVQKAAINTTESVSKGNGRER